MAIIVQKFGGTSVATPEARKALLNQVRRCKDEGNDVVLVVSAMGRSGDPYATDTLISIMEKVDTNIAPRKKDLIISCGEIISCSLVSHYLESNGIPSEPLTGGQTGITTSNNFGNSDVINIDTNRINNLLNEGKVVVIAGFQGTTVEGEITTLGRGGSDTTAVVIGGYLGAQRVDIFTDVPGIAKTDPRVVPSATYLPSVKCEDMFRLADNGAKVIHPRAVKAAIDFEIPVRVRSTFVEDLGTLITNEDFDYDQEIIGIAFEKDAINTRVYILFEEGYKEKIKFDYESYFQGKELVPQDVVWNDRELMFTLPTVILGETIQGLYDSLHDTNKVPNS